MPRRSRHWSNRARAKTRARSEVRAGSESGLTRSARDFDFLARNLAARYRVVCPDVVGRGDSDWLTNPNEYQVPTYVGDMVTLLARLDVESVDWVGTSLGGLVGMALAALPGSPITRPRCDG